MAIIKRIINGRAEKVHAPECRCYPCHKSQQRERQQQEEMLRLNGITEGEIHRVLSLGI